MLHREPALQALDRTQPGLPLKPGRCGNTHDLASLYDTFAPAEARRLAERLEIHYTPKHGSWLNIAEIELSALHGQCLRRRIPSSEEMRSDIAAWQFDRNHRGAPVNWRFTTKDARIIVSV